MEDLTDLPTAGDYAWQSAKDANRDILQLRHRLAGLESEVWALQRSVRRLEERLGGAGCRQPHA